MDNPIFIGKVLHHLDQLASTNLYAAELLAKSTPLEGTVISTYNQFNGRGQIGSQWESAPGRNLSLSVILYPNFLKPTEQFMLNKAISLGVRSFLDELTNKTVFVKWPNDLIINGKKLAGILIQNNLLSTQINSSIIGLGINVNQQIFEHAPNPTSLSIIQGKYFDLNSLRLKLFAALEHYYLKLKALNFNYLNEEYLSHLYRYEEESSFLDQNENRFDGVIKDIDAHGRLAVEVKGKIKFFNIKEIKLVN